MYFEQEEAIEKFLATPELVEMLLPFLKAKDILHLAQSGLLNINILQNPVVWNRFIRRSAPSNDLDDNVDDEVDRKKAAMVPFVHILWMMKDHRSSLLDLLNLICERFSSEKCSDPRYVKLKCSSNQTKRVSPLGFVLLETVEGAFGSTFQRVKKIFHVDGDWPIGSEIGESEDWLSSLSERVSRQRKRVRVMEIAEVVVSDENVDELVNLVEHSREVTILVLKVLDRLKDWSKLKRILGNHVVMRYFEPHRDDMFTVKREDLRAIWDATSDEWFVTHGEHGEIYGHVTFYKSLGESEWHRLKEFVEISNEEMHDWFARDDLSHAEAN